jgi:hypothetical protein
MNLLLVGIFVGLFFLRATAPRAVRVNWAVGWLSLGIVGNVILSGYEPAKIETPLGALNAVWCWAFFLLALVEGFLAVERKYVKWKTFQYLLAFFAMYILNIFNLIRSGSPFTFSNLYLIVFFMLIIFLGPTIENLDGLRIAGVISMLFVYYLLITNYNPIVTNELTGRPIPGVSAPEYRNFMWGLFGLEDRYHGPFGHPNQLGIFSAFFATILATSNKLFFRVCAIGFIVLTFCAASRTSMIVAIVGICLVWNRSIWALSVRNRTRFLAYFVIILMSAIPLAAVNYGTGRGNKFSESFSTYPINLFYGTPSFYIENTFLNNLFGIGVLGFLIIVYLQFAPIKMYWRLNSPAARICIPMSIQLAIASMAESVVFGSVLNSGVLYLLVLISTVNSFTLNKKEIINETRQ